MDQEQRRLVAALRSGQARAKKAVALEAELKMPRGHTQEPTRGLVARTILTERIPIGSCSKGYFLIDNEDELARVVDNLQSRIDGMQARIDALKTGWGIRKQSKAAGGDWPK